MISFMEDSSQGVNSSNSYKADKYKKDAEKITANNSVIGSAPADVQKATTEFNDLEKELKKVYLSLSNAYETNNKVRYFKI